MSSALGQEHSTASFSTPAGKDEFTLIKFEANEALSDLFTYNIEAISKTMAETEIERGKLPNYWGVKFDENHNNLYANPLIIGQWVPGENGKPVYKVVYPEELAVEKPLIPYFKQ